MWSGEIAELEHWRVGGAEAGTSSVRGPNIWHPALGVKKSCAVLSTNYTILTHVYASV